MRVMSLLIVSMCGAQGKQSVATCFDCIVCLCKTSEHANCLFTRRYFNGNAEIERLKFRQGHFLKHFAFNFAQLLQWCVGENHLFSGHAVPAAGTLQREKTQHQMEAI